MSAVITKNFRPARPGPELVLQQAVQTSLRDLFAQGDRLMWAGVSLPVGAGEPDIVLTACQPEIIALSKANVDANELLAYLRAVGRVKIETVSRRLGKSVDKLERALAPLTEAGVVVFERGGYLLGKTWRTVLPDIVTIEVKVSNWRRALAQAARNRIFAHRSFVALPERTALRVRNEPLFRELGVGILSVDSEGGVRIVRRARRSAPKVWSYYYSLACKAAEHLDEVSHAVPRARRASKAVVS